MKKSDSPNSSLRKKRKAFVISSFTCLTLVGSSFYLVFSPSSQEPSLEANDIEKNKSSVTITEKEPQLKQDSLLVTLNEENKKIGLQLKDSITSSEEKDQRIKELELLLANDKKESSNSFVSNCFVP